ncbi:hypothetical protein ABPG74_017383 [Tetrahymena malaccensis]
MKVEVEINFSLNGYIFILLIFYCFLYAILTLFKCQTISLFTQRVIQLQINDLHTQITQNQKNISLEQPIQNLETIKQARNSNRELFKYIDQLRENIIQSLGKAWNKSSTGDELMIFLQQNNFFKKFYSVRVFYKEYLDFLMQKYHFLSRIIKNRGVEWFVELNQLVTYLIIQLSLVLLIYYIICQQYGQDSSNQLDSNSIFLYFVANQIIASPISIFFSSCEYLVYSKSTQFYKSLYVCPQNKDQKNPILQFKPLLSLKLALKFSKLFEIINIIIISVSFFQLGVWYLYDQNQIDQFISMLILHLIIAVYEILIGRYTSCLFIGFINILFRNKQQIIQCFIANYLQKFFETKSNKHKDNYNKYYEKVYEEYQLLATSEFNYDQFLQSYKQQASLATMNQHPNIEITNTVNPTKQFDSLPTQQISFHTIIPIKQSKLVSSASKNIPSSFQLKQLTAIKTQTDYENTFPIIGSMTRQESKLPSENKERIHNNSISQIEESYIKEEDIYNCKQIKNFQNQCCDLLNKNFQINTSAYSDRTIRKINSFSGIQRASIENQMSINLLPLHDLEFPGLVKKSQNILPLIQSYSNDGTQINIQKECKNSQFSFLNQTQLSNSSISNHVSKQQQIQRNSLSKVRKNSNYSQQRSSNSFSKVNQNNNLNGNDIEFRDIQIKRNSSEENSKKSRSIEQQQNQHDNKVFCEKEQQLIDFVEAKKKQFLEEHQKVTTNLDLFFNSQKTIDHAKRKSSNMSNFIDYCDYKEIFQSYKNNFNSQEESQKFESSVFTN